MFSRNHLLLLLTLICTCGAIQTAVADDSIAGCLKYIPGEANVVVVLRVEHLLQSPRGTKEGWAKQTEDGFLAGTEPLPPWVNVGMRAAQFSPEEGKIGWSLGLILSGGDVNVDTVAEQERVKPSLIAGKKVVRTSRGSYVTQIDKHLLAVVNPAYRQVLARWIRQTVNGKAVVEISPYLKNAILSGEPHLLIAVDTDYLFDPDRLDAWIKANPSIAQVPADSAFASRLFRGLRGVQLTATVEEATTANVHFDFSEDVGNRGELVKRVFLDFLDNSSAALEDFQNARVASSGKAVDLQVNLSDSNLKRILSLVVSPHPSGGRPTKTASNGGSAPPAAGLDTPSASPSTSAPKGPAVELSRKYYRAVNQLVDDLSVRVNRATKPEKTAVWHDNYAKKIDQMSINGVHPDLVKYGASVAARLRALSASLRGVPLKVDTIQGSLVYNTQYNPGYMNFNWWGGGSYGAPSVQVTSNLQQVREQQAAAIEQGNDQRQQIWSSLENDRQAIRQRMNDVFHADFETK